MRSEVDTICNSSHQKLTDYIENTITDYSLDESFRQTLSCQQQLESLQKTELDEITRHC